MDLVNNSRSIWKSDAFAILALVLFWPAGLFLMWKYAPWRKGIKIALSILFLIGGIPLMLLLFVWGVVVGLTGYSKLQNITNPRYFNQSHLYNCRSVNTQRGRCTSIKYGASFEYPLKWSYVDIPPQGIGFNDQTDDVDSWLVSLDPAVWENDRAKQSLPNVAGNKVTTVNEFWAVSHESKNANDIFVRFVKILDKNMLYSFQIWESTLSKKKYSQSEIEELNKNFDQMISSFQIEK